MSRAPGPERGEQAWQDPAVFRQFYREYFPRLYAYVSYRVGRTQDAEDLVAESFLRLVEARDRFAWRGELSLAAWLFRVAHNLINDFYRRDQHQAEPLSLETLPDIQASMLLPDDALMRQELFTHLRTLIGALPPRRQEVITLKFFGGLRNQEIAAILGLDERTIASHLCRGLDELHRNYVESASGRIRRRNERGQ